MHLKKLNVSLFVCGGLAAAAMPGTAHAAAFDAYGAPYRAITMPATGDGSFGLAGDCLPDGRIIAMTGRTLFVETGVGSGVFAASASLDASILPAGAAADPAFVRISPDGTSIALGLGSGKPVAILPTGAVLGAGGGNIGAATAGVRLYNVSHSGAAWQNGSRLALTAGTFGQPSRVTLLDTLSDPAAPSNPVIIVNIGGASGGIAFDAAGRLFTGNGFDLAAGGGPSTTGTIRAFSPAEWNTPGGADFETAGTFIGEVLSVSGLGFDAEGNLAVGGGDFGDGDFGYLGLLNGSAIASALAGGGPIDAADPLVLRRLMPAADASAFYSPVFNAATGELLIGYGDFTSGANTWFATIPAPGCSALALVLLAAGRRRR